MIDNREVLAADDAQVGSVTRGFERRRGSGGVRTAATTTTAKTTAPTRISLKTELEAKSH